MEEKVKKIEKCWGKNWEKKCERNWIWIPKIIAKSLGIWTNCKKNLCISLWMRICKRTIDREYWWILDILARRLRQ